MLSQGHRADESLDADGADDEARDAFVGTSATATASPTASVTASQRTESRPDPWDRRRTKPPRDHGLRISDAKEPVQADRIGYRRPGRAFQASTRTLRVTRATGFSARMTLKSIRLSLLVLERHQQAQKASERFNRTLFMSGNAWGHPVSACGSDGPVTSWGSGSDPETDVPLLVF